MTPSLNLNPAAAPGPAAAAVPAVPGLAAATPPGAGEGDGFAALLAGLQLGNLPAPAPSGQPGPAADAPVLPGTRLPAGRQDTAAPLPPGNALDPTAASPIAPLDPGLPETISVLPEPIAANLPAPAPTAAPATRLRALIAARPLPAPIAAANDPAPASIAAASDPAPAPIQAAGDPAPAAPELRPELGFGPEAAPPAAVTVTVAARVAETPAPARAAAPLDPVRAPAPERPADAAPPAAAAPEPVAPEPAAPPLAADSAEGAAAPKPLPPAFAGLTPAQPQGRGPRDAFRIAATASAASPAAPAAPAVPLAPAPALAPVVPVLDAAPVRADPAALGFHPAASVELRPAAAAAPPAPPAPLLDTARADWLQGMVDQIAELRDAGGAARAAQIRLAPDALGQVEIRIEERDDGVHVTFTADTAQARALLNDAAPRLHDLAEARGLRLAQANVDAGGSGERRPGQPPQPAAPLPAPPRAAAGEPGPGRPRDRLA